MNVLVADDDRVTRRMVCAGLERWGYHSQPAASGEEAWTVLSAPSPPPLAILDWNMPDLSGPELCVRVRATPAVAGTYLILLTARNESSDLITGLDAGADDFVSKPYSPDELRARLGVGRRVVDLRRQLIEINAHLEERVRQRTREVERLLRWDEELLRFLGHDLRTPLTPLTSLLPILLESEQDPERRELLQLAIEGARSIHAISSGVAKLCQATATALGRTPREFQVLAQVEAALEQAHHSLPIGDRRLRNEVNPSHHILADPLHFRRTLDQLIANAVRFTPDEATIILRSTPCDDGFLTLSVEDSGIGLEACHLNRVFEPFQKADPSRHDRSHLGLGLAMARIFVEQHGGRIWAQSDGPGRGSTFHCTWPTASTPQPTTP